MTTSGLIPIHPLTLVPNYRVGTNIFLWNDKTHSAVKFLSSEQIVSESIFSFLLANPNQRVFVEDSSHESYFEYLVEHLECWLVEPRIPRILKTAIMVEYLHGLFRKAFENKSIQNLLKSSMDCSHSLTRLGHHIQLNGRELQRSLRHDSSFVTHAVNTALYAYLIADHQGYCDEMVFEICAGAMLHDVGKIEMNSTLQNDRLHPTEGFRILCREPGVTETHLMVCYQHHERPDGKGFPVGLMGDEIHIASRICAVANRYDGLTSERGDRPAMTRSAALRVLESEKNTALEREVTKCLEQKMSQTSTN